MHPQRPSRIHTFLFGYRLRAPVFLGNDSKTGLPSSEARIGECSEGSTDSVLPDRNRISPESFNAWCIASDSEFTSIGPSARLFVGSEANLAQRSQQPQHGLDALLHYRHFGVGECGEGSVAQTGAIQSTGLVDHHLAVLQQPVAGAHPDLPAPESGVDLGGQRQDDHRGAAVCRELVGLVHHHWAQLAELLPPRRVEVGHTDLAAAP
jgi:hypothetical protein